MTGYTVQRFADALAVRLDSKERVLLRQTSTVPTNYEYLVAINDKNQLLGLWHSPFYPAILYAGGHHCGAGTNSSQGLGA